MATSSYGRDKGGPGRGEPGSDRLEVMPQLAIGIGAQQQSLQCRKLLRLVLVQDSILHRLSTLEQDLQT